MTVIPGEVTAAAHRIPHLRLLVLYGSRGRDTAHERSDWDFAYMGDEGLDRDTLLASLVDATRSDRVDIVDLDRAGALIRHRIARDGVVIYEAIPGLFDRFRLDAIHNWCDLEPVLTPIYEHALREAAADR